MLVACSEDAPSPDGSAGSVAVARAALTVDIYDCAGLQAMALDLGGDYRLAQDVDCADFDIGDGRGFKPLGNGGTFFNPFYGTFDGNGHLIYNLRSVRKHDNHVGLFGITHSASISRVGLVNVELVGYSHVGPVAGGALYSTISECFGTGSVFGYNEVGSVVGGLKYSTLSDSYGSAILKPVESNSRGLVVGAIRYDAVVTRTYSSGTFNSGTAVLSELIDTGGSIEDSFFDCTIAGNCGGEGVSTGAMQTSSQYTTADWDFVDVWSFTDSGTYPCLRWQYGCTDATDTDDDGTPDSTDDCPEDPDKILVGTCGCGVADDSVACVTGSPCETAQDCIDQAGDANEWSCSLLFPGGFCSIECDEEDECPEGTECQDGNVCVPPCDEEDECVRDDLDCLEEVENQVSGPFCRPTCALECTEEAVCNTETNLCDLCAASDTTCDDVDDDCDESIDEDYVSQESGCGVGACTNMGAVTCVDGEEVDSCEPGSPPSGTDATCDGVDDDCSGVADEDYSPGSTGCGVGACASTGTSSCVLGVVQSGCTPGTPGGSDTSCNGVDNDCNGSIDDGYVSTPTTCSFGACAATGVLICVSGSVVNTCAPGAPASSDITCDGVDDDCDSTDDDDYQDVPTGCQQAGCMAVGLLECVSGVPQDNCMTYGACVTETDCDDDADNDTDEAEDCADVDCALDEGCLESDCGNEEDDNDNGLTDCQDPACAEALGCIEEICGNSLDDDADGLSDCADLECDDQEPCLEVPPLAAEVAPPLDPTVTTRSIDALSFLFEGEDPIQRGVVPGTMEEERIALVTGRVMTAAEAAISGVRIDVLDRPELGVTYTDLDGEYHLAVNGGGTVTLRFALEGYIPAQRMVETHFREGGTAADLVLMERTATVTEIDVSGASTEAQAVVADVETDDDGVRQAVVIFPAGTEAQVYDEGGELINVEDLNLRITEHTVGAHGLESMPAPLPPSSAFTYAVDITADEAGSKRHGIDTVLSEPVSFYVDNFIGFETGTAVPTGYYDGDAGVWKGIDSGVVIEIVGESGGLAEIDADGDTFADEAGALAALGFTEEELEKLADLYDPDASLWRIRLPHLSTYDANMGGGTTEDPPPDDDDDDDDEPPRCDGSPNSVVECFTQELSETIAVPGTPFHLRYDNTQVRGRSAERTWKVPLRTADFESKLNLLGVRVRVSPPFGAAFTESYPPGEGTPAEYVWTWDGLAFGRPVLGPHRARIDVTYDYPCEYSGPARFGNFGGATLVTSGTRANCVASLTRTRYRTLEASDFRAFGMGGWTIDAVHQLEPEEGAVRRGDGKPAGGRTLLGSEVVTPAYGGSTVFSVAPDGALYVVTGVDITRFLPDGSSSVWVAGSSGCTNTTAHSERNALCRPTAISVAPNGSVYVADSNAGGGIRRILRINPRTMEIERIAGSLAGFSGEGGLGLDARLSDVCALKAAADGSVFFIDCTHSIIQRVGPDGFLERIAGSGSTPTGFTATAADAKAIALSLGSGGFDVDDAGNVYFVEQGYYSCSLRRVATNGELTTPRAKTTCNFPISNNWRPRAVLLDEEGDALETADFSGFASLHRITLRDGATEDERIIGDRWFYPECGAMDVFPQYSRLGSSANLSRGPDGHLYVSEYCGPASGNSRIRRIRGNRRGQYGISLHAAADRSEVYEFDTNGRHLRTLHPLTGGTLLTFEYDEDNLLEAIEDGDGNRTLIERDEEGIATAIVAPFGQRTELGYDENGYLSEIEPDPEGEPYEFEYADEGLMIEQEDPNDAIHEYTYDDAGRIIRSEDSLSGFWDYDLYEAPGYRRVTQTTAEGRTTVYEYAKSTAGDGSSLHTVTLPTGLVNVRRHYPSGATVAIMGGGTTITTSSTPDPAFGNAVVSVNETVANGGASRSRSSSRAVTLAIPNDPFSLTSMTETSVENGHTTTRVYTASTRTWTTTSPQGRVSTTVLDTLGRVIESSSTGTLPVEIGYDELGRLETAEQGARLTSFAYDSGTGFLESQTNAELETTTYGRDAVGRATTVENHEEEVTTFGYDDESHLTSVTPPERPEHELTFTPVDTSDEYIAPQVGVSPTIMSYDFDLDRALTKVTQPDSSELEYDYNDTTGRLATATIPDAGTYTYSYNAQGHVSGVSTTGGFGTVSYEYGATLYGSGGSLVKRLTTSGNQSISGGWSGLSGAGSNGGSIGYLYDNAFNTSVVEVRGGTNQNHGFFAQYNRADADDLVTTITPAGGAPGYGLVPTLTLTRSPLDGHLTGTTMGSSPHVVSTDYDVDVDEGTPGTGDLLGFTASVNATEIYGVSYVRDGLGRITRLDEVIEATSTTRKYEYDGAGRLIRVRDDEDEIVSEYEYDGNGARVRALTASGEVALGVDLGCGVSLEDPVDDQDRLCRYGDFAYVYDENGRLSTKTEISNSDETSYTYDGLGRLRRVVLPDATQIDYVHDALGRRIGKVVDGIYERGWRYGPDSLRPLAELDEDGEITLSFVYETRVNVPDYIVDLDAPATYRVITDHLGSVRLIVNVATGDVAQRIDYDEFGNVLNDTAPGFQPFGFGGGLYDADTGLVRFGERDYDAVTGRWTAKDPIGFEGRSANLYSYVGNDPVNRLDPQGLADWGPIGGQCCNSGSKMEFYISGNGIAHPLPPGQCSSRWEDCDGSTCNGVFYKISDLEKYTCLETEDDKPQCPGRAWTPGGGNGAPGPPDICGGGCNYSDRDWLGYPWSE